MSLLLMTTNSPHWPPGVHSFRLPWWRAVAGGFLQPTDPRATVEAPGAPGWPPQGRASSACSSWHLQASIRFGIPAKFPPWPERERTSFDHPVQDALISCPGIMAEAPVPFREKSSPDSQGLSALSSDNRQTALSTFPRVWLVRLKYRITRRLSGTPSPCRRVSPSAFSFQAPAASPGCCTLPPLGLCVLLLLSPRGRLSSRLSGEDLWPSSFHTFVYDP